MIVLSNSAVQTINAGQSIAFDTTVLHTGCAEGHRNGSPAVKLRATCACYSIAFNGNIASATADSPVQLSIEISGAPLPETLMVSTPSTANVYNSVSASTVVRSDCCDTITVTNTGTNPVTLDLNSALTIRRVA